MSNTNLDLRWFAAVIDAGLVQTVPLVEEPQCCCRREFRDEHGTAYRSINAGCKIHGVRSNYQAVGEVQSARAGRCAVSGQRRQP